MENFKISVSYCLVAFLVNLPATLGNVLGSFPYFFAVKWSEEGQQQKPKRHLSKI